MVTLPKRLRLPENLRNSRRHEQDAAKALGGRLTKASGAGAEKGDVRVQGRLRVECKVTRHASYSVSLAVLDAIERAAALAGERAALAVRFVDEDGRTLKECLVLPGRMADWEEWVRADG